MHGEIFTVAQQGKHSVGDSTDAGLQHRAIVDQAGDVARDGVVQVGQNRPLQCAEGPRGFDDGIEFGDVDEAVSVGAGHLVVNLRDDVAGNFSRRNRCVDPDAETAKAMGIGRRKFSRATSMGIAPFSNRPSISLR